MQREAEPLSYWLLQNAPLEDAVKLALLALNSPIQRLRLQLSYMRALATLACVGCHEPVCRKQDMFAMSSLGLGGMYVNPHGHVHDVLTVRRLALDDTRAVIALLGAPSEQNSWFPGYAWTIVSCAHCDNHLGWRFTAVRRHLRPLKFWGLCRPALEPSVRLAPQLRRRRNGPGRSAQQRASSDADHSSDTAQPPASLAPPVSSALPAAFDPTNAGFGLRRSFALGAVSFLRRISRTSGRDRDRRSHRDRDRAGAGTGTGDEHSAGDGDSSDTTVQPTGSDSSGAGVGLVGRQTSSQSVSSTQPDSQEPDDEEFVAVM